MTKKNTSFLVLVLVTLFLSPQSKGQSYGAYNLYPQGTLRAVGLGGASTALSDNASGIISNPAGLVMSNYSFSVDGSNNPVDNTEQGTGVKSNTDFIFAAMAAHLGKNWAVGAGISTPYSFDSGDVFSGSNQRKVTLNSIDVAIAKKFDKFSIGVTGRQVTADLEFNESNFSSDTSTFVTSSFSEKETVIYPTVGISFRDKSYGLGVSYTPKYKIEVDTTQNSNLTQASTFFRDIEVPAKLSAGIFVQNGQFLFIGEVNKYDAPGNSILVESNTDFLLEEALTVFHIGVEYELISSKKLDVRFRGGFYSEPSRVFQDLSRKHITYGIEARMGPVVIGVSIDQAEDFQNTSQALSVSFGSI